MQPWTECPLKPPTEVSRIINPNDPIAEARLPMNACTRHRCEFWTQQLDAKTGKIVSEYCVFKGYILMLGTLNNQMSALIQVGAKLAGLRAVEGQGAAVPPPPPKDN